MLAACDESCLKHIIIDVYTDIKEIVYECGTIKMNGECL